MTKKYVNIAGEGAGVGAGDGAGYGSTKFIRNKKLDEVKKKDVFFYLDNTMSKVPFIGYFYKNICMKNREFMKKIYFTKIKKNELPEYKSEKKFNPEMKKDDF